MSPDDVLTAVALNRLAYGPTPDELERVKAMGPQAYIDEQLNMEGIPETMDAYVVETTNAIASDPTTNWTRVVITGRMTTTNLYLFMTQPGDVYIDDIQLVEGTNAATGPNLISNGDFEDGLTSWIVNGSGISGSAIAPVARSGWNSLRVAATVAGSTSANTIWQWFPTALTNNTTLTLSYWYLPAPNSSRLRVQLGGSGMVSSAGGIPPTPGWIYAKATGAATSTSQLYVYLSGAGECYLDEIKLVSGTQAEVGPNLLQNGDFESPLAGTWNLTADFANSTISSTVAHSGSGSLRLVATAAGAGSGDSVYQVVAPALVSGQTYTVSYWYRPMSPSRTLTVRLSGTLLNSTPDTDSAATLYRRLDTRLAAIDDLRAWFCLHAVGSRRQLFEVLSQFWENHFVTQYQKSYDYLGGFSYESGLRGSLATDWENREMTKWRNAMLNPQCTFYDLLKISAESPAMIVYLDTVNSKGTGTTIANENYARELFELFTFGVDNGYDQNDIVQCSRAWTGWSVDIVDPENINNPLAPVSATYYPNANSTAKSNIVGVWAFNYKSANHGTNRGPIFLGKTVPARFGAPWAGRNYQLTIPVRTGAGSIQDGYDVITHLANQPFTQEYISVKLCRLFVHEDFPNPSTVPGTPEYAFYDYTNPNRSAEAELVHQCMLAWETGNPKGQLRSVLNVIFSSELFRSHAAAAQKVKTPLEYLASSVRALRSVNPDGSATATTDGYSFKSPLSRMGGMGLFDRDAPDGYPENGSSWISAGTLTERIRYVQAYCIAAGGANRGDAGNQICDPVGLLKKKLPSTKWNQAGDVADYFINVLYSGEGKANLDLYRTATINFLNTDDNGAASPFLNLATSAYDTRVRSAVAMLLTLQRFQEQ